MKNIFTLKNGTLSVMLRVLFVFITALIPVSIRAQVLINSGTYPFTSSSGAVLEDISVGRMTLIYAGTTYDNYASTTTSIGFTFQYAGTNYTTFRANSDGVIALGASILTNLTTYSLNTVTGTVPYIAPYWDDLSLPGALPTPGVFYKLVGTAPSRKLVVQWNVTCPKGSGAASMQLWLHETTNIIEFVYGTGFVANANGYGVGLNKGSTDYVSINTAVPSAAYGAYTNNTGAIAAGTKYTFIPPDATAPVIAYTALLPTVETTNRVLSATIADATGVPTSGTLQPRIYFKKNLAGTWFSSQGVLASGTATNGTWNFTIDNALMGGVAQRDVIYYYVIAQDEALTPNIGSLPAGVVATDVNTVTTHPAAPNSYLIKPQFTGTLTVGTGGDFASLTAPGGLFESINTGQINGNIQVNIISDLTGETGTVPLNAWVEGPGGPYTITINPVGARSVSGTNNTIKLVGAKGLTINGLNDGTNSLTFTTASFQITFGASNNTFTNLTITGGGQAFGFNDSSGTFPANCSNNVISNNTISGWLYFGSWATATTGLNNVINNNTIRDFSQYGIHIDRGYRNFTVSNNDIYQTAVGNYSTGIYIYNEAGTTNIFNNKIHDLRSGTGLGVLTAGIYYRFGLASDILNIYNNSIYLDATTVNADAYQLFALWISGAGTSNIYHNSIYLGGTGIATGNSGGLYRSGGTVNFKNNSIYNARSGAAASLYYKNYGIFTVNTTGFVSDYNLVFADGTNGVPFSIGGNPGSGTDYATLAAWTTATTLDAHSVSANPGYTSGTDLTPDTGNPNSANLDNHGTPLASVTTDILGNTRSTTTPDIGAYEFLIPVKTLNLKLFLEGLYNGAGAMNQAADATGPHWPAGVADHIKVELRDASTYATIAHTVNDAALATDGTLTLTLPVSLNASYYVTIKHRNSIETTTPTALSFAGSVINHDFTTGVTKAFGDNMKLISGVAVIFTGDVNQDGTVDTGDMIPVDNDSFNYATGYLASDVNGDGSVDTADMIFIDNNSANYVGTQHP